MPTRMATSGDQRGTKRVRRTGAARTVRRRSFSMLPDDVLVVIYRFLAEYPSSRACFAYVCRSWQAAVAEEPRVPVLPWLLLSPRDAGDRTRHAHCPEDGIAMRFQLPLGAVGKCLVGGYAGGWVVSSQPAPLRVFNIFTGANVALSEKQNRLTCPHRNHGRGDTRGPIVVSKIVFSGPPNSDACIMAAMTKNCGIALCRVGCPNGGWTIHACQLEIFIDIAFYKGKLYGLSGTRRDDEFVMFKIGVNKHGAPVVTAESRLALEMVPNERWASGCKEYAGYIIDLHGKLMIAVITWWRLSNEPFFRVYELVVDAHTRGATARCKYKWVEVTSLGDHALFLGQTFSMAVHLPAETSGDIERNHIYYCKNGRRSLNPQVHGDAVLFMISNNDGNLKYKKEGKKKAVGDDKRIKSTQYFMMDGRHDSMWLLPPTI